MTEEIDKLISAQLELNAEIKRLKEEKELIKSQILVALKTKDMTEYETPEGNTAVIRHYTRTSIDKEKVEAFCEETGKEISYFQKTSEVEELRVK